MGNGGIRAALRLNSGSTMFSFMDRLSSMPAPAASP
jgi:hypothetical protein